MMAHLPVVKLMLENGKNVLCETTLGVNVRETREMLSMAKSKNLFLMEAMWNRCQEPHQKLRDIVENGEMGKVLNMETRFCAAISEWERMTKRNLCGGTLPDLGIYVVHMSQWVYQDKMPVEIKAVGDLNEDGVDLGVNVVMKYEDGGLAYFTIDQRYEADCYCEVRFENGTFKLPSPFWSTTEYEINGEKESIELDKDGVKFEEFLFPNSEALALEADHVRDCLAKGLKESPLVTHEMTMNAAKIMQEIRKQIGVVYNQD